MTPGAAESSDAGARLPAPTGEAAAEWVDSFLLTRPGKTYRIETDGEGPGDATRAAAVEAARILTDEVVRAAAADGDRDQGQVPLGP